MLSSKTVRSGWVVALVFWTAVGVAHGADDLSDVTIAWGEKTVQSVRVLVLDTGGKTISGGSVKIEGRRFTSNGGGFNGALQVKVQRFPKRAYELIERGKLTWEKEISKILRGPGNGRFNVILWAGYPGGGTDKKATREYLQTMSKLAGKFSSKKFICMTGTMDTAAIQKSGRTYYDAAKLGNSDEAQWKLWIGLARGSAQSRVPSAVGTIQSKNRSVSELVAEGKRLEEKGDKAGAYNAYKEALLKAKSIIKPEGAVADDIRHAERRVFSLKSLPSVSKEADAWDLFESRASSVKRELRSAQDQLGRIAAEHPGTHVGGRATELAKEIEEVIESLP